MFGKQEKEQAPSTKPALYRNLPYSKEAPRLRLTKVSERGPNFPECLPLTHLP
jgi:hypothetical protein